jgi:hypothetical protein
VYHATTRTEEGLETVEQQENVPFPVECMRRQGAALLQELYGNFPHDLIDFNVRKLASNSLTDEQINESFAQISDNVTRAAIDAKKARGVMGSVQNASVRAERTSTIAARQRVLLQMMVDVNEFVGSGVYKLRRLAPENTPAEEACNGAHTGVRRNVVASKHVYSALSNFFLYGCGALAAEGLPAAFVVRPRTRTRCGCCGDNFDFKSTISRDVGSVCIRCGIHFCTNCYVAKLQTLKQRAYGNTLTTALLQEHCSVLICRSC